MLSVLQYPPEKRLMAVDFRVDLFASFNPDSMLNTEQGGWPRCKPLKGVFKYQANFRTCGFAYKLDVKTLAGVNRFAVSRANDKVCLHKMKMLQFIPMLYDSTS